jgi:hypothetical protein
LEDSISGSASSEDEGASEDLDTVNALVNKTRRLARSPSPEYGLRRSPQTALAWFHSPPSTQIGIYRALFLHPKDTSSYLSDLKDMQTSVQGGRTWAMFMVAGGHFAGAVVRVSRPDLEDEEDGMKARRRPKRPRPDVEVLQHKTFHRYTSTGSLVGSSQFRL